MSRYRQKTKAFMLMVSILFVAVFAGFFALRTTAAVISLPTPLDFVNKIKDSQTNHSYGYAWNKETKTLTLTNLSMVLNTAEDTAFYLPADSTIYLPEGTKNEILLPESAASTMSFYGIKCEGNLTIEGKGSLSIKLLQPRERAYGIYIDKEDGANLTIKESFVSVEVARTPSYCFGIFVRGGLLVQNGASLISSAAGVSANIPYAAQACGIYTASLVVQNATAFGKVGASANEGGGALVTAGINVSTTVSVLESGAVTASNENDFSDKSPALWGTVERTASCIEQNATLHGSNQYAQTDASMPLSIGTAATFTAYEGKTYASPKVLSSPYSEYIFLGWFDERGVQYQGELGKAYTAKWAKGDAPLFYGALDLSNNAPSTSDSDYGYAWNADTKTLTLSNFKLYAPEGGLGLVLPDGATVVCEANTISEIYAEGLTDKGINAAIYTNGAVTFKGQGTMYAKSGKITQQEQSALTVAAGIYGSFTVDGPALHLFGGELSHPGSVGFYVPVGGKVVFEEGSLNAQGYGLGRAGMLSSGATFTTANKSTIKVGNESADIVLQGGFHMQNKERYLYVFKDAQADANGGEGDGSGFFTLGRVLLLVGLVGIGVGAVAFLGSLKKKKRNAETALHSENETFVQAQDENQNEK